MFNYSISSSLPLSQILFQSFTRQFRLQSDFFKCLFKCIFVTCTRSLLRWLHMYHIYFCSMSILPSSSTSLVANSIKTEFHFIQNPYLNLIRIHTQNAMQIKARSKMAQSERVLHVLSMTSTLLTNKSITNF